MKWRGHEYIQNFVLFLIKFACKQFKYYLSICQLYKKILSKFYFNDNERQRKTFFKLLISTWFYLFSLTFYYSFFRKFFVIFGKYKLNTFNYFKLMKNIMSCYNFKGQIFNQLKKISEEKKWKNKNNQFLGSVWEHSLKQKILYMNIQNTELLYRAIWV